MLMATTNLKRTLVLLCCMICALVFVSYSSKFVRRFEISSYFNLKAGSQNATTEIQNASTGIVINRSRLNRTATSVKTDASRLNKTSKEIMIDTSLLNRTAGFRLIDSLVVNGQLDFSRVASYALKDEWLTPMDREILTDEPVKDLNAVADERFSTIQLVSRPKDGKVKVGDKVTVRVDIKDATGKQVLKGGHRVRVWMVQVQAATRVTDMRNGSFVASLPVLWNGTTQVRAALVRPREFQGMVLRLMSTMKMMNQNIAAYSFNHTEQVVLCSFVPVIPGHLDVCNLTDLNGGLPWYCGKPSKEGLHCDHWAWSTHSRFPQRYPMSNTENDLMRKFTSDPRGLHLLKTPIVFNASQEKKPSEVLTNPNCFPPRRRDSWIDQLPSGYWENTVWRPLNGCPLPPFNANCYNETNILFFGDSNAREMYVAFQRRLKCREIPDPGRSQHPNMLHVPLHCSAAQRNVKMSWYPHSYPFFSGCGQWSDTLAKKAPSAILDTVPGAEAASNRKYVIAIHHFIHYSQVHSYAYALHVRDAARAVSRLLARNPGVKVFVRGPHSVTGNRFQLTGDYHVERSFAILRHEFRDLMDRVVLLDDWDMTVANENVDIHPNHHVLNALVDKMNAFVCT